MEDLYAHVLKKAQEREAASARKIEELEEELRRTKAEITSPALAPNDATTYVHAGNVTSNITNTIVNVNISVNMFGQEATNHITTSTVQRILAECGGAVSALRAGEDPSGFAANAVMQAALLIYSDPDRPENITCYLPNKRDGTALVHGEQGWEIIPVPLVLTPMAQASLDLLFDKQPFEADDLKLCETALQLLRSQEEKLVLSGANLRTVLIRNKDLLSRVLSCLPVGPPGRAKLKA